MQVQSEIKINLIVNFHKVDGLAAFPHNTKNMVITAKGKNHDKDESLDIGAPSFFSKKTGWFDFFLNCKDKKDNLPNHSTMSLDSVDYNQSIDFLSALFNVNIIFISQTKPKIFYYTDELTLIVCIENTKHHFNLQPTADDRLSTGKDIELKEIPAEHLSIEQTTTESPRKPKFSIAKEPYRLL